MKVNKHYQQMLSCVFIVWKRCKLTYSMVQPVPQSTEVMLSYEWWQLS